MKEEKIKKVDLSRIIAKGLFGYVDYDLNKLEDNQINFIIAQNGMGKTTTLNMLHDLSTQKFLSFYHTKFEELRFSFKITYEDKSSEFSNFIFRQDEYNNVSWCKVQNLKDTEIDKNSLNLLPTGLAKEKTDKGKVEWFVSNVNITKNKVKKEACNIHYSVNGHGHYSPKNVMSLEEIKDEYDDIISKYIDFNDFKFLDKWNVFLIPYDRIKEKSLKRNDLWAVDEIRKDMMKQMREHVVSISDLSLNMEGQTIEDLINSKEHKEINLTNIVDKINKIERKLQKYQLIPNNEAIKIKSLSLNEIEEQTLKLFLNNRYKRVRTHEKFLKRLDLFQNLLTKLFVFKKISLSRSKGIQVFLGSLQTDRKIELRNLSSGEQHFLILVYKIFFEIPENSFVLIDEPETSLHLVWQDSLIKNMEEIGHERNIRFICATHSPALIGEGRDSAMKPIKPLD